jgi:hypothetical protein
MRLIAIGCGLKIALGLVLASGGGLYQLYACNLVLLGLIGGAGMFSPTIAYVTREGGCPMINSAGANRGSR